MRKAIIIDSKKLPKGLYSAIEGIRRTSKKNQQPIFVDEIDPKIFDDKSRWPIFENHEDPSYGLGDKGRHRNRRLFRLHGVGNQNRKNMN